MYLFIYFVCVYTYARVSWYTCGGQENLRNMALFFHPRIPRIKHTLSDLAARTLMC